MMCRRSESIKFLMAFSIVSLLFVGPVSAADISLQENNITLNANSFAEAKFDVDVGGNEAVTVDSLSDIENVTTVFSDKKISSNKTLSVYFLASGGYKVKNRTANFNFTTNSKDVTQVNDTFSNDFPGLVTLSHNPDDGTLTVASNGNELSGSDYDLSAKTLFISSNVTGAEATYNSTTGDISTVTKTVNINKGEVTPEENKALIELQASGPFQRGDYVPVKIIDNINNEALTGCKVMISSGEYSNTLQFYSSASRQVKIPEKAKSNSLLMEITSCKKGYQTGFTRTIQLTSWNTFYNSNKLVLKDISSDKNGTVEGKVVNKNGEAVKAKVSLDGKSKKVKNGFSFSVDEGGNYTIKAVNAKRDSNTFDVEKTVKVTIDSDDDGVMDSNDECSGTTGDVNNAGCTPKEVSLEIWKDGVRADEPLTKANEYQVRFVNNNGSVYNMTGAIMVDGDKNVKIEEGTALFKPEKKKIYRIHKNATNEYGGIDESITVEGGFLSSIPWTWIGVFFVVVIVVVGVVFLKKGGSRSGASKPKFKSTRQTGPAVASETQEVEKA